MASLQMHVVYFELPSKRGRPADLSAALSEAVACELGEANAAACAAACAHVGALRHKSLAMRVCYGVRDVDVHQEYLRAVSYVLEKTRVPGLAACARPPQFAWECAFDARRVATGASLQLDKFCVSFNVASGCCDLSACALRNAVGPGEVATALREAANLYQRAAGIFDALSDGFDALMEADCSFTPDLSQFAFTALRSAMLANAQIATYSVACSTPNMSMSACALVAAGVRDLFDAAARQASVAPLKESSVHERVGKPAAVLADVWAAEACVKALDGIRDIDMNQRLARISEAGAALTRANGGVSDLDQDMPLAESLRRDINSRMALVSERDQEIQRQNFNIYRTQECPMDQIVGHVMVKAATIARAEESEQDQATLLFDCLRETTLTAAAQQYDALAKNTISAKEQAIEVACASLRERITSLQGALAEAENVVRDPPAVAASTPLTEGSVSEDDAVGVVRRAATEGGLPRLLEVQAPLKVLSAKAEEGVNGILGVFSRDATEDQALRDEAAICRYGLELIESNVAMQRFREKLRGIRAKLHQARNADGVVQKKLDEDTVYLSGLAGVVLSGREAAESTRLRTEHSRRVVKVKTECIGRWETAIAHAKTLLESAEVLQTQLDGCLQTYNASYETQEVRSKGEAREKEVGSLVRAKLQPVVREVEVFLNQASSCAEQLNSELTRGSSIEPYNDESDPMVVVWKNYSAGVKFAEVLMFLQQGKKFWSAEEEVIRGLRGKVDRLFNERMANMQAIRADMRGRGGPGGRAQDGGNLYPSTNQSSFASIPPPPPDTMPYDAYGASGQNRFPPAQAPHEPRGQPPVGGSNQYVDSVQHPGNYQQSYDARQYEEAFGTPPPPPPPTAPTTDYDAYFSGQKSASDRYGSQYLGESSGDSKPSTDSYGFRR